VLEFEQFLQGRTYDSNKEHANAKDNPRKRWLKSSSDCSFLERALPSDPLSKNLEVDNVSKSIEQTKGSKTRRQRQKFERSNSLEGSFVPLSIKPQVESFEKRRRHKTREDRYGPKVALVDPKTQANWQKKSGRKEKSKSRRKFPRSSSKKLMDQFSSKNVGHDRLTVRMLNLS
jgi:hypothetical protein